MTLRSDHVAGAAFVGFGILVLTLSGTLPIGRLSMPGAGFLPNLIAWLLVGLGALLFLRARESAPLADIDWSDIVHALSVIAVACAATWLYNRLGFILTMFLMLLSLLLLVERRNIFRAGLYSLVVVMLAFGLFARVLRAPLPTGPFGF
jgi:Tripartite tricarboxylate transporter TctB family